MITVNLLLTVLGLVLLFLAGIKLPEPPRIAYGWMGLLLIFAAQLVK